MNSQNRDFDKEAATWDENPGRVKMANNVANTILDAISLKNTMKVLDFGCGTGLLTLRLQPFVASITAVDSSAGMLEVLNRKIESQNITNITTEHLDIAPFYLVSNQRSKKQVINLKRYQCNPIIIPLIALTGLQ